MFIKDFTIRSRVVIKEADQQTVLQKFTKFSADKYLAKPIELVEIKEFSGIIIKLYIFDKAPLFFQLPDNCIFPSVYLGWQNPRLLPTLYVSEESLYFLLNGSDIMRGALLTNEPFNVPNVEVGDPIFITVRDSTNRTLMGPYAIGRALMTTSQIHENVDGKVADIFHRYKDALWRFGNRDSVPKKLALDIFELTEDTAESAAILTLIAYNTPTVPEPPTTPKEEADSEDELLRRVFLYAVNNKIPADQKYPMDAGQFYASFILKSLPEGRRLDIKKTSWKKFTVFLNDVNKFAGNESWFVTTGKHNGNDVITALNYQHPNVTTFSSLSPMMSTNECYAVTNQSCEMLKSIDKRERVYTEGSLLSTIQVARLVLDYVLWAHIPGKRDLTCKVDTALSSITEETVGTEIRLYDVVQKIILKMGKVFAILRPDGRTVLQRHDFIKININIVFKMNSSQQQKLTHVINLHQFGIDAKLVANNMRGNGTPKLLAGAGPEIVIQGDLSDTVLRLLRKFYGD